MEIFCVRTPKLMFIAAEKSVTATRISLNSKLNSTEIMKNNTIFKCGRFSLSQEVYLDGK